MIYYDSAGCFKGGSHRPKMAAFCTQSDSLLFWDVISKFSQEKMVLELNPCKNVLLNSRWLFHTFVLLLDGVAWPRSLPIFPQFCIGLLVRRPAESPWKIYCYLNSRYFTYSEVVFRPMRWSVLRHFNQSETNFDCRNFIVRYIFGKVFNFILILHSAVVWVEYQM